MPPSLRVKVKCAIRLKTVQKNTLEAISYCGRESEIVSHSFLRTNVLPPHACLEILVVFTLLFGSAWAESPRLGKPITAEEAAQWDLNVFPDGKGLPEGRGNAIDGKVVYGEKCALCHGEGGRGATAEELAGGANALNSETPDKTIGLYWPYATTIFDVTRRSMPMNAPGSLSNDELYAVTAYLLFVNNIIGERDEMNAKTLPKVKMPNRNGFIGIDAKPGPME